MKLKTKLILWFFVAAVAINALLGVAIYIGWSTLGTDHRLSLGIILDENIAGIVIAFLLYLITQGTLTRWLFQGYLLPLTQLVEETQIIQSGANPAHRIVPRGGRDLKLLAELINRGADALEQAHKSVDEKIQVATSQIEEEKDTLAALISELKEGVVVSTSEGRVLLYSRRARELLNSEEGDEQRAGHIGLGRSLFSVMDRQQLSHAQQSLVEQMKRENSRPVARFVTNASGGQVVLVEMVPVLGKSHQMNGFILLLQDISERLERESQRSLLLQSLSEGFRGSLGNIRAAIETILEYPDMSAEQLQLFRHIISEESLMMSDRLQKMSEEQLLSYGNDFPLEEIPASDMLVALKERLESCGVSIDLRSIGAEYAHLWMRIDSYSLFTGLAFLIKKMSRQLRNRDFALRLQTGAHFLQLDLLWQGEPIETDTLREWRSEPLLDNDGGGLPITLDQLLDRHESDLWSQRDASTSSDSFLRLLLPRISEEKRERIDSRPVQIESRPEFYDFNLFDNTSVSGEIEDMPLRQLSFTIFDTETTGLNPSEGDQIIQIGAVRVVNGRILNHELFDQLVDPQRKMSQISIEITGIQPEMLVGQPTIDTVLPRFHSFSEGTVLVAHNAAFDMKFLQILQKRCNIEFHNPVLDTLLLSAVVHPGQDLHNLEAITERLGINIFGRHTALGDAMVTAEVFLRIWTLLEEKGITTLREAWEASKKTYYSRIKY